MTATEPDTLTRLRGEGLILIPAAADHIGVMLGYRPHEATVRGWARRAYRRSDGKSVLLETCALGKRLFTSRAACERFVRATQRNLTEVAEAEDVSR
jgi:hypothetical protein